MSFLKNFLRNQELITLKDPGRNSMKYYRAFLFVLLFAANNAFAQSLPLNKFMKPLYDAGTRTTEGKPGAKYWQNTADYTIDAVFDPATLLLSGKEKITYVNNSPDTLNEIVFKLYPNLYQKGAQRLVNIDPNDINEGMQIDNIAVAKSSVLTWSYKGTNMSVTVPPLLPGQSIDFDIKFHYTLNHGSHTRTGQVEPNAAFIAYFFPRIAVYDDYDGWNRIPYLGVQEFYNDFCNFNVAITVPAKFAVWATGDLLNCNEVLTPVICDRIKQAEASDNMITIIDS